MDEIGKYRVMIGKQIEYNRPKYLGFSTAKSVGVLVNLKFDDRTKTLYAEIRRNEYNHRKDSNDSKTIDTVPVGDIIMNSFNYQTEAATHHRSSSVMPLATVQYNNVRYTETKAEALSIGQDVVWLRNDSDSNSDPLIGKITFIGENRDTNTGISDLIAVVQFDQSTISLPRHIPHPPCNRNIINVNNLLPLSIWLQTHPSRPESMPNTSNINRQAAQIHFQNLSQVSPKSGLEKNWENHNETESKIPMLPITKTKAEEKIDEQIPTTSKRNPYSKLETASHEFKWNSKVSPADFYLTINNSRNHFGIQGHDNSCYMDSSLFCLFTFNNTLDYLLSLQVLKGETERKKAMAEKVKYLLRSEIITPLREKYFLPRKNMAEFRQILVTNFGEQYRSSYMDVEEFMLALFNLIKAPELFTYNHGGGDYVHQILLKTDWEESQKVHYLTLQHLLDESFLTSEVKLAEPPKSTFIIKLPVSNGQLIPCTGVIPNLILDLSEILDGDVAEASANHKMHLHAVICLRSNHFASFVCMDYKDKDSRWVFMDSKPASSEPEVYFLENVSKFIKEESSRTNLDIEFISKHEPHCNGMKLFENAYMCIYVS